MAAPDHAALAAAADEPMFAAADAVFLEYETYLGIGGQPVRQRGATGEEILAAMTALAAQLLHERVKTDSGDVTGGAVLGGAVAEALGF